MSPNEPLVNNMEIEVGQNFPFTSSRRYLRVLADMLSKDHQVTIHCPWTTKPIVVMLTFSPPLSTSWKLHTVSSTPFISNARGWYNVKVNQGRYTILITRSTFDPSGKTVRGISYIGFWDR